MKKISIMIIVSLLSSSCIFTPKLYKETDPNRYVRIAYSQVTEAELIEKKIAYYKNDETASFYIEKNTFQKFQDYSIRTLATPVTVALDTATIMVVAVGFLFLAEAKNRGREAEEDRRLHPK